MIDLTVVVALLPGYPHVLTKNSTASNGKLGGAWERGYTSFDHTLVIFMA